MLRYLVFAGSIYYPCGGWDDYKGTFPTIEDARMKANELARPDSYDWSHVVDTNTMEIVP